MNTKNQTMGDMPRISRILVAIDFSPHASNALAMGTVSRWRVWGEADSAARYRPCSDARVGIPAGQAGVADRAPLYVLREQVDEHMAGLKALIPDAETVVREASPRRRDCGCRPGNVLSNDRHGNPRSLGIGASAFGQRCRLRVRHSKVPVLTIHMD